VNLAHGKIQLPEENADYRLPWGIRRELGVARAAPPAGDSKRNLLEFNQRFSESLIKIPPFSLFSRFSCFFPVFSPFFPAKLKQNGKSTPYRGGYQNIMEDNDYATKTQISGKRMVQGGDGD
jgi:hypothetical protein